MNSFNRHDSLPYQAVHELRSFAWWPRPPHRMLTRSASRHPSHERSTAQATSSGCSVAAPSYHSWVSAESSLVSQMHYASWQTNHCTSHCTSKLSPTTNRPSVPLPGLQMWSQVSTVCTFSKSTSQNEEAYVNRKRVHTINVQAVCDTNMSFLDVFAKWTGATHDSFT